MSPLSLSAGFHRPCVIDSGDDLSFTSVQRGWGATEECGGTGLSFCGWVLSMATGEHLAEVARMTDRCQLQPLINVSVSQPAASVQHRNTCVPSSHPLAPVCTSLPLFADGHMTRAGPATLHCGLVIVRHDITPPPHIS